MFHFKKGKTKSYNDLASDHYLQLKGYRKLKKKTIFYKYSVLKHVDESCAIATDNSHLFFKHLRDNNYELLEKIITGKPQFLHCFIADFDEKIANGIYPQITQMVNNKLEWTEFGKRIATVFNYGSFSSKASKYNAYRLCKELKIDVCPYCNRNYVYTISFKGEGVARPELDHFVNKSRHPVLALSFYNLIPSCHICNSGLKHAFAFDFETFLHPYEHAFHDIMEFTVEFKDKTKLIKRASDVVAHFGVNFFFGDTEGFELLLRPKAGVDSTLVDKAKKNMDVFKLNLIYNCHKDLVQNIIQSAYVYNDDYIDNLFHDFGGTLFRSRDDIYRYAMGNFNTIDDMPNRTFSKLTWDIAQEFGLKI